MQRMSRKKIRLWMSALGAELHINLVQFEEILSLLEAKVHLNILGRIVNIPYPFPPQRFRYGPPFSFQYRHKIGPKKAGLISRHAMAEGGEQCRERK